MKQLVFLSLILLSSVYAKNSNIERVDRYIEDKNCKPHVVKVTKHLEIYRTCDDTYVLHLDDDGEIISAILHNANGKQIDLMPKE